MPVDSPLFAKNQHVIHKPTGIECQVDAVIHGNDGWFYYLSIMQGPELLAVGEAYEKDLQAL